jgi:predicted ferric reductase
LNVASAAATSRSQRELVSSSRVRTGRRRWAGLALWLFVIGNGAVILWIWGGGGADGLAYHWHSFDAVLLGLGRIAALGAGYLALIEVLLLARLPFLERLVGFDRLTIWHRWNGHAVLQLVLAHVVFTVWGYARQDKHSFFREYWNWLTLPQPATAKIGGSGGLSGTASGAISGGISGHGGAIGNSLSATSPYPGIITATVGTALLVAVVVTSIVLVRRKLSYEWWYAIHFTVYAAIALSWFHMIPDGNELVIDRIAADYWRGLFALALALVLYFRVARPLVRAARFDLRVSDVIEEAPGVVSLRISGRGLERLGAQAGQFFFWRFLTGGFWYTKHPFSLSEAPNGDSFRITVKNLGDHTAKLANIPVGTRVFAEGPFGVFTAQSKTEPNALLIAGGIGITPVRALLEQMDGDLVALYRVTSSADIIFADELDHIASTHRSRIEYLVGDHRTSDASDLLSPTHLKELVPDIAERDVYICGPPGLINTIIPNLRRAAVPRHHLHVERFAL